MTDTAEASTAASSPIDEIAAHIRGSGTACTARLFLETLSAERRAAVEHHVAKGTPFRAIGRTCQTWGFAGSAETMTRHLSRACKCPQ